MAKRASDGRKEPVSEEKSKDRVSQTTSRVKKLLSQIRAEGGRLFFTRECLDFGRRSAVDTCLSRMVTEGTLERVAYGSFILAGYPRPTQDQIAAGKAKAFGRVICSHGVTALKEFFNFDNPETDTSYATDGATSSFRTSDYGMIHLKQYAPRKLTLGDTPVGKIIRALWHCKTLEFASRLWALLQERIGRAEREALRRSCHIMPTWMVDLVLHNVRSSSPIPEHQQLLLASLTPRVRRQDTGSFSAHFDE